MRERNAPACEYANELISFVYSELDDKESQDFKIHLNTCRQCSAELDSFGEMRDAIGAWKYQSLAGVSPVEQVPELHTPRKKSAVAALWEFFDLSPLWMKGAVGLATVLFCVFAFLATTQLNRGVPTTPTARTYTQQEVDALVEKTRAENTPVVKNEVLATRSEAEKPVVVKKRKTETSRTAPSKRPLSKTEREQLAVDLRLSSSTSDETVHLIGDRINE